MSTWLSILRSSRSLRIRVVLGFFLIGVAVHSMIGTLIRSDLSNRVSSLRVSKEHHKTRSGLQQARSMVEDGYERILNASNSWVPAPVPPGLEKHFMYDSSARQALVNMSRWLYEAGPVSLPLFPNIISELRDIDIYAHNETVVYSPSQPRICVGIFSARRPNSPIEYLVQTVTALLTRMEYFTDRSKVIVHVFNVDKDPEAHNEVNLVSHLVPTSVLKGALPAGADASTVDPHVMENVDYTLALRQMSKRGIRYPVLLEDDALATHGWVNLLETAISQLESRTTPWFAVRLYTARERYPKLSRSPGISDYNQKFNAVAMLFNAKYTLEFAEYVEWRTREAVKINSRVDPVHIDHAIADFATQIGADVLSFEPVIFQHTGIYSSVNYRPPTAETANEWFMSSRYFESDGLPIEFEPDRMGTLSQP